MVWATRGLEWRAIMPSSQHQNGACEVMIKMVKGVRKSLLHVLGDTKISLNEMFTVFAEVSNIVNERPIEMRPNNRSATDYLLPKVCCWELILVHLSPTKCLLTVPRLSRVGSCCCR